MKRSLTLWASATLAGLVLAGCEGKLPQAEREFSGNPEDARNITRAQGREIDRELQARAQNLQTHDSGADATLIQAGFFDGRQDGYAVWRDGTVGYINSAGGLQILDKLPTRLDEVLIAGRRIVGLHANGTMGAWNTANLSQQVVIRPQEATFNQTRVYDVAATPTGRLVMAAEGERLEHWSLASGNRLSSGQLRNVQPRAVAPNSNRRSIVYGALSGEIRQSSGRGPGRVICKHDGPVLAVRWLAERNLVLSSAKDGSVLLCNMGSSLVVWRHDFRRPAYNIVVSETGNHAAITPAFGRPVMLDLNTVEGKSLAANSALSTTRFAFAPEGNAISQHGVSELRLWRTDLATPRGKIALDARGQATGFAINAPQNRVAVLRDDTHVSWFDLARRRNIGLALFSDTEIASLSISDDGERMLLVLIDGRVLTLDTPDEQGSALRVGQAEE